MPSAHSDRWKAWLYTTLSIKVAVALIITKIHGGQSDASEMTLRRQSCKKKGKLLFFLLGRRLNILHHNDVSKNCCRRITDMIWHRILKKY